MNTAYKVQMEMIQYYKGDAKRIHHFLKVFSFVKIIGTMEHLDEATQEILEITALTHDIGIKNSEMKYHSTSGQYQQIEGPLEAKKLLESLEIDQNIIERVCWLIAHHHTYKNIESLDYQILVEADFLVNIFEGNLSTDSVKIIRKKIFKTESSIELLDTLYLS